MPSFDIVSEIAWQEVRNAVANAQRELASRWDFQKVIATITLNDKTETVTLTTESEFQLQQQQLDLFYNQLHKRGIERNSCTIPQQPNHGGKLWSFEITFKQGIDTPLAKRLVQLIKSQHPKVQSQIQDKQIRVSDKSRNTLQAVMTTLRTGEQEQPLQFTNFRD